MPRVHASHLKGNLAVSFLKQELARVGILADEIRNDYGEDLLLQTNLRNVADPFAVRIQVKFVNLKKRKNGRYSFRFSVEHLQRWIGHTDPVLICLCDPLLEKYALIDPKETLRLWDLAMTGRQTISIQFSEHEIVRNSQQLQDLVWRVRIEYYSAKISQLESTYLYGIVGLHPVWMTPT